MLGEPSCSPSCALHFLMLFCSFLVGAKERSQIDEAFSNIYPILRNFKKTTWDCFCQVDHKNVVNNHYWLHLYIYTRCTNQASTFDTRALSLFFTLNVSSTLQGFFWSELTCLFMLLASFIYTSMQFKLVFFCLWYLQFHVAYFYMLLLLKVHFPSYYCSCCPDAQSTLWLL